MTIHVDPILNDLLDWWLAWWGTSTSIKNAISNLLCMNEKNHHADGFGVLADHTNPQQIGDDECHYPHESNIL